MATGTRRTAGLRGLITAGVALIPGLGQPAVAQQPTPPKQLPADMTAETGKRVVAFIHGNVPISREELGEFLIVRGGMDKIELLVNKRIIDFEAKRQGVSVLPIEIVAGLEDDLRGASVDRAAFIQFIRERYGKTLYEWEQDVIRPRLLLGKMCREKITVSPDDLKRAFETRYGEKREAQLIVWPKGVQGVAELTQAEKDAARSPAEFDKLAARQPDQKFAAAGGRVAPVGRHIDGEDPNVEAALFALKEGEISPWVETKTSWTCVRCLKIIPPADPNLTVEKVEKELQKEVHDRKLSAAIPALFAELKKVADPKLTVHVPLPPGSDPKNPPSRMPHSDPKVLALIYGTTAVTREDLGEFLIARGGYEKVEFLVNKRIIDMEAARRGINLSPEEIAAGQKDYVGKLGVANLTVDDFVKHVLPRRGLTKFSWTEDVIKPELILAKMCRDRVKVAKEDVEHAFENRFGEKRRAKVILWKKDEARLALKQWDEARKGDAEFDRIARGQSDPALASKCGEVEPIGRYVDADDRRIEQVVFNLREGEVSQLFETPVGIMCVKCVGVVPPQAGVTPEAVRADLEKQVFDRKLAQAIPSYFAELKQAAGAEVLLRGPTTPREFQDGVFNLLRQAGGTGP